MRIALLLMMLAGCAPGPESIGESESALSKCAGLSTLTGIDVSYYQGTIDWAKVKASGRAFAIARIGDGADFIDPRFTTNYAAIKAQGMIRGSYQFFRAADDPLVQADIVLDHIGTLGNGDLPPVLDLELSDGQADATVIARAKKWLDRVEAKIGRPPIIYTSPGYWSTLGNPDFARYPLWVAHWGATCPTMPGAWRSWKFWQHSDSGSVSGISGAVDLDKFDGDLAALKEFASPPKSDPPPSPKPSPSPMPSPVPDPPLGISPLVDEPPSDAAGGCSTLPRRRAAPWFAVAATLVAAGVFRRMLYSIEWRVRTAASGSVRRPRCASSSSIRTSRRSSRNTR